MVDSMAQSLQSRGKAEEICGFNLSLRTKNKPSFCDFSSLQSQCLQQLT
ncbi:hypothetical protein TMEN_4611 [Trichophyton mentagrophytes]|nr:hypothetical protein TMEN_4611 [Trichophyton mentagrophytes]